MAGSDGRPAPAFAPAGEKGPGLRALVTGSLAYDFIIDYPGHFKPKLAFRDEVRHTAVFPAEKLRRSMGGCAGNIAYTLAALGASPLLAATVGSDGDAYLEHLSRCGIGTQSVLRLPDMLTAQAFIANDELENQLIFFFAGAMGRAHEISLADLRERAALAIVSPNGHEAMLAHSAELSALGIPFILDLGQGLGLFSGAELRKMLGQATYAIFNRMELDDFCRASGLGHEEIVGQVEALAVTDSMRGSIIWAGGERHAFEADVQGETVDPTGCGDAYRGGLMHAMLEGRSWPEAGRLASRVAGIKARFNGGQEFSLSEEDLAGA